MEPCPDEVTWDLIVVGGGVSGILASALIARRNPQQKILILEKEARIGGRLRSSHPETQDFSCGLKGISEELYNFWNQILKEDPDGPDLPSFESRPLQRFGVLQAGKIRELPFQKAFSAEGAKVIAGGAGARDWQHIDKIEQEYKLQRKSVLQNFGKAYGGAKKSPAALVASHLGHIWGIPDIWSAQSKCLLEKGFAQAEPLYSGHWDRALSSVLEPLLVKNVELKTSARVLSANYKGERWHLVSEQGSFEGKKMLVATSIWDGLPWIQRSELPKNLATLANRTKPASLVILSETILNPESVDLPDILLVTRESVQIVLDGNEICFQATLDYELTMNAPAVVKAVKRLKRARKHLLEAVPELALEGEHIALIPVAWGQPLTPAEQKYMEKIKDIQEQHIMFCGDCYGTSVLGDQNILYSIHQVADTFV